MFEESGDIVITLVLFICFQTSLLPSQQKSYYFTRLTWTKHFRIVNKYNELRRAVIWSRWKSCFMEWYINKTLFLYILNCYCWTESAESNDRLSKSTPMSVELVLPFEFHAVSDLAPRVDVNCWQTFCNVIGFHFWEMEIYYLAFY